MHAQLIASPRIESHSGEKAGSFRDLHGAALAVRRLVEDGFSSDEVFVRPHRMEPLEGTLAMPTARPLRRRVERSALIAASLGGAVLVAGTDRIGWGTVAAAVAIGLTAAVITLATHRVQAWRVERRRRRTARLVRASQFDVVVTARRDVAEHRLASWWDPDAIPAGAESVAPGRDRAVTSSSRRGDSVGQR